MTFWTYALLAVLWAYTISWAHPIIGGLFEIFWPGRMKELAERHKTLRSAVKIQLVPFMAELGFKLNRKPLAHDAKSQANTYSRRRGEFADEIHIYWWSSNRPWFAIEFWTDQTERMIIPGVKPPYVSFSQGVDYARIRPRLARAWEIEDIWYGQGGTLSQTMIIAKKRLLDLDEYLRTGVTSAPLGLVPTVIMGKDRPLELFPPAPPPTPPTLVKRFDRWFWRKRY